MPKAKTTTRRATSAPLGRADGLLDRRPSSGARNDAPHAGCRRAARIGSRPAGGAALRGRAAAVRSRRLAARHARLDRRRARCGDRRTHAFVLGTGKRELVLVWRVRAHPRRCRSTKAITTQAVTVITRPRVTTMATRRTIDGRSRRHGLGRSARRPARPSRRAGNAARASGIASRRSGMVPRRSGRTRRTSGSASRRSGTTSRRPGIVARTSCITVIVQFRSNGLAWTSRPPRALAIDGPGGDLLGAILGSTLLELALLDVRVLTFTFRGPGATWHGHHLLRSGSSAEGNGCHCRSACCMSTALRACYGRESAQAGVRRHADAT